MSHDFFDRMSKVLMIGDSGVGKTCLLQRFDKGEFRANTLPTIAIDFSVKSVSVGSKKLKMQIWDTAGQEKYNTLTSSFFKSTNGVLVVFALDSRASFNSVSKWMGQISALAPKDVVVSLVGNKADLSKEREVASEEGADLAKGFNCEYFETSAATGANVEKVFSNLAEKILAKQPTPAPPTRSIGSEFTQEKKEKGCCK